MGSERDRAIAEAVTRELLGYGGLPGIRISGDLGDRLYAIIAAVDAQHPAPALPREVAMRVGRDVWREFGGVGNTRDLDAIVSRHLPTDEEREAERAVVEAALRRAERVRSYGRAPVSVAERDAWSLLACDTDRACDRLLAIRAKRGAK